MSIVVKNLTKTYGSQKAVDDITFEIKTGEIVGFLGPNGAGKSTTMKMLTCFLLPDHGEALVNDFSIHNQPEEVKRRLGYLPENNPLYEEMPVIEYLRFSAEIQDVPKDQITDRIRQMITECGLELEKHKKIGELSKGYRQRVGLAQAMVHDPDVLILDEPTTGLDPNQIVEIRNLIRKLGKEKTVILSSHILPEVEATCDRILIINQGRIVADGTAEVLRQQAQGSEILHVQIESPDQKKVAAELSKLKTVEQVQELAEDRFEIHSKANVSTKKPLFDLCVKNKWYLLELTGSETKLEDVFRELTKQETHA